MTDQEHRAYKNGYAAGHYEGYLDGVVDTLNWGECLCTQHGAGILRFNCRECKLYMRQLLELAEGVNKMSIIKGICEKHGEVEAKTVGKEIMCSVCYDEFIEGVKRGLDDLKKGRFRPLSEVKKELESG